MKKIIHIGLQQLTQKVIEKKLNQIYIYYIFFLFSESDLKMSHCSDVQIYFFCNIANMQTFYIIIYLLFFLAVNPHLNMLA